MSRCFWTYIPIQGKLYALYYILSYDGANQPTLSKKMAFSGEQLNRAKMTALTNRILLLVAVLPAGVSFRHPVRRTTLSDS